MKQLDFFNTINIGGYRLKDAIKGVQKQNNRVLEIMKQVNEPMTPLQVSRVYNIVYSPIDGRETPYTSIRRAITTLTKKGALKQLQKMKEEQFGKPNHYWRVATKAEVAWYLGEETDKFHE